MRLPRAVIFSLVVVAVMARIADAQSTATIRGVVRDSTGRPMANADVIAIPGNLRARTDSTGRFMFGEMENGRYVLRARRVGYSPVEWTVDLQKSGGTDVQIVLATRLPMLDTVFVTDGRRCEVAKYEGFMCRRATAKGTFVDYTDIDTMQVVYTADLLRDVGGFATTVISTRNGPTRIATGANCTIVLVNGVATSWSSIPDAPYLISGIEVYKDPKDIPKEYSRFTWGKERCWLVAFWTYDFMMRSMPRQALPKP
jgi:hypothetical protein